MIKTEWNVSEIMDQLRMLGTEQTKRTYINHGAKEPLYGITTGALKPLAKKIGKNYQLSMQLYDTGNYDAMFLAGMIADAVKMTESDFEYWMEAAYCHGLADYVVAVTLAQSKMAKEIADAWIKCDQELYASAGWSCYAWLLGYRKDETFDKEKIRFYLDEVKRSIHTKSNRVRYAMNNFVIAVGISYLPLHEEAVSAAKKIGKVYVDMGKTNCKTPVASDYIQKAVEKNRIGFKRRSLRC